MRKYEETDFEIMPRLLYEFSLTWVEIIVSSEIEINICWSAAVAGGQISTAGYERGFKRTK